LQLPREKLIKKTKGRNGRMLSVIGNIKTSIALHQNRIAVIHNDNIFTYQDLETHSNKLAHYLKKFNIKKDSKLAFLMRRSFNMLTTILAIWKVGATYIPLDPKTPKKRIEHILNDISPACIISDPALLSKISYNDNLILTLADPNYVSSKETHYRVNRDFDDLLAYIIYTSGSTGQPKGVMLTHANVANHIKWLIQDFQFSYQDCFSFNSSMAFDFSVACTILPLAVGAKIVITMGCNDRLAQVMGLPSRYAIKGMTDFDFDWGEGVAESFIAFDKKVMETGSALTTEDTFKEANGNIVTVLTTKTPLKGVQISYLQLNAHKIN
jgi:acyl-coenzyme A synthetase/AMP-(fatty) acid ligase